MVHIPGGNEFALPNRPDGPANRNSVHEHRVTGLKTGRRKFVLSRNVGQQRKGMAAGADLFALFKVGQCDQNVVVQMNLNIPASRLADDSLRQ